jgi:uncharacterized RDD family membrane protein YckC
VGGRDLEFEDGEVTLGRSRSVTVRVEHDSVSRSHALLTLDQGRALLKDLNSSNGTFAGGQRILGEKELAENETIQLGAAVVLFRAIPPSERVEKTTLLSTGVGEIPSPVIPPAPLNAEAASEGEKAPSTEEEGAEKAEKAEKESLEISARGLQTQAPAKGSSEAPHAAHSALEAVHKASDEVPKAPVSPPRPVAAVPPPVFGSLPVPPRPNRPTSLADVPIGDHVGGGWPRTSPRGEPAGFVQRFLATFVDGVILSALNLVLAAPVMLVAIFLGVPRAVDSTRWEILAIGALSAILIIGVDFWYTIGGLARSGRTPGKALLRIVVVGQDQATRTGLGYPTALRRTFFFALGLIPFALGPLLALFRRDERAWHDLMAKTWVIRAG